MKTIKLTLVMAALSLVAQADRPNVIIIYGDNGPVCDDGTTVKTSTEEVDRGHDASGMYRGGKYQIYEGGTRVPFIVRWPARIKPGAPDALVNQIDYIANAHLEKTASMAKQLTELMKAPGVR